MGNEQGKLRRKSTTAVAASEAPEETAAAGHYSENVERDVTAVTNRSSSGARKCFGLRTAKSLSSLSVKRTKSAKPKEEAAVVVTLKSAADKSAAAITTQRQQRQTSVWSFGNLSGRLNWSFSGATKQSSFRHQRNKSTRKSLPSLNQQQQRRSKTSWHKPLTNAIFNSHFKDFSRNDQFHIEHLIAKGAFGVVFQVSDKTPSSDKDNKGDIVATQQYYALKVLKKSKIIAENSVQQIKDEADIQKVCGHHPFIVQQIDLWQNRRNLHILSEYVPNGELFSKISHFSIDLIRLYLAEIALAIDFLHNAGIIYRDAKPENILLTSNYHIKLTDFGLSKWLKLGATTKTMCGTYKYMAPEILLGQRYGHAVDWWSLGVIVCQMFTEKCPDTQKYLRAALVPNEAATEENFHSDTDQIDNVAQTTSSDMNSNMEPSKPSQPQRISLIVLNSLEFRNFLPSEVESLQHEAKDVLKRLLEVDTKLRVRSVMALQRIALYKNFRIDTKHLLSFSPFDIIQKDNIKIFDYNDYQEVSSAVATKAFQDF